MTSYCIAETEISFWTKKAMEIKAQSHPTCALCGGSGDYLHSRQRDRLFGAGGLWNFKRCANLACGLVWLDPMPLPEDIAKAYANYYTHAVAAVSSRAEWMNSLRNQIKREYWASKYDYEITSYGFIAKTMSKLMNWFPIQRTEADAQVRFLSAIPAGRLLDVGCGSGEWLLEMRERGWQVQGIDFDENAVNVAKSRGLQVECGSLEEHGLPADSFDAITLSHVIEHVPDPSQTLRECTRVLKPGGRLVLFTPNCGSLGHRFFKNHWRGLEPPRHLHLFSIPAMDTILGAVGLCNVSVQPFIVTSIIYESILLRWGHADFSSGVPRNWPALLLTEAFKWLEVPLLKWDPTVGDCLIAIAEKPRDLSCRKSIKIGGATTG